MLQILNFMESIAKAKADSNLITEAKFNEARTSFDTLRQGFHNLPVQKFMEVVSASGFNTYMTDAVNAKFFSQYDTVGSQWRLYTTPDSSSDLRDVTRYDRNMSHNMQKRRSTGSRRQIGSTVGKSNYHANEFSEVYEIPWEVILNDDLRELMKVPSEMANAAVSFEDSFVSSLYNNATTQAYLIGLGAQYAGAAALDEASLVAGINAMTTRRTVDGTNSLIRVGSIRLVVGQALAYSAAKLLANILAYGDSGNILKQYINGVVVDPYLVPVGGKDPWYLFSDPTVITTVPVLRLSGTDKPYVFTQESAVRVISGSAPTALTMGSYDSGVISYTVGSIIGGNADATKGGLINPLGIYYSAGG